MLHPGAVQGITAVNNEMFINILDGLIDDCINMLKVGQLQADKKAWLILCERCNFSCTCRQEV